jgi:hypothetical protein
MEEISRKFKRFSGAYSMDGKLAYDDNEFVKSLEKHGHDCNREAIFENGDVFKHKEGEINDEIEWVFSPFIGWKNISEKAIEEIEKCYWMWDYYGKVVEDDRYADPEAGWRNDFFVMKSSGEWKYRIHEGFGIVTGYWKSSALRKKRRKFEMFEEIKRYLGENQDDWTNECDFINRYN